MPYEPVPVMLYAGINKGVSEDSLNDGEVAGASNFLFKRGESQLRPGLRKVLVTGALANLLYAKSFLGTGVTATTLLLTADTIYVMNSANVVSLVQAAQVFTAANANATVVNGFILIANQQSGGNAAWYDTAVGNHGGLNGDGAWRYLTALGTRGFGAYRLTGGTASTNPISVGWSDQGNPLEWATGGASTAGSAVLADMTEDISGLCTLHNLVVICRHTGFHIGYPTSIAFPPFRFEAWNRDGVGVFYPETIDVSNNKMFFVGEDDVYTFDLQQITPIGAKIRDELLPILRAGFLYRGFIARGTQGEARSTYNLAPIRGDHTTPLPHYIYDIYEDNWSRCDYDLSTTLVHGLYRYPTLNGGIAFFDSTGNMQIWDSERPCETRAFLESPTKFVGPLSKDIRCDGVLLKHRNFSENMAVKVSVNDQLFDREIETSERRTLGEDTGNRKWARTWFRNTQVGQGFTVRIDVDAGQRFSTNYLELTMQEAGAYQGRFS